MPGGLHRHRLHARTRPAAAFEDRGAPPVRRAVPSRGRAHPARHGDAQALPLRRVRLPADLDDELGHRVVRRSDPRPGRRRAASSAGSPAGSTRRSPPRSCTKPSVRNSRVSSSTPDSCARARATKWSRPSAVIKASSSSTCARPDRFFERLAGVVDPEEKRKAIGELFIRVFEDAAQGIEDARFLVQGTLYPDVIESGGGHGGKAATIKSHHNVGGLPDDIEFELVEPLRAPVQGRGAQGRRGARPARRDRVASAVPRARARRAHHRRGHAREGGHPPARRRDRARGDQEGRPRARDLAGVRGATRHPVGRRDGGRADLRLPDHHPGGHERGRHDGRLGPLAVRAPGADVEPDHQRGAAASIEWRTTSRRSRRAPSNGSDGADRRKILQPGSPAADKGLRRRSATGGARLITLRTRMLASLSPVRNIRRAFATVSCPWST